MTPECAKAIRNFFINGSVDSTDMAAMFDAVMAHERAPAAPAQPTGGEYCGLKLKADLTPAKVIEVFMELVTTLYQHTESWTKALPCNRSWQCLMAPKLPMIRAFRSLLADNGLKNVKVFVEGHASMVCQPIKAPDQI